MKYIHYVLIFFGFHFCCSQTSTSQISISLETSGLFLDPGKVSVIKLGIRNNHDFPVNIRIEYSSPDRNLSPGIKSEDMYLEPEDYQIGYIPIKLKSTTRSGFKLLDVRVLMGDITVVEKTFDLFIKEKRKLTLDLISVPKYILDNQELTATYLISNLGNRNEYIKELDLSLSPGQTHEFQKSEIVKQSFSPYSYIVFNNIVAEDNYSISSNSKSVKVYPSYIPDFDPFHRIPAEVGVSIFDVTNQKMNNIQNIQVFMKAQGYVNDKKEHFIEAEFRGPNRFNMSRFATYDRYFVGYNYKGKLKVNAGDFSLQKYRLPLFSRYIRGGELSYSFKKLDFSLYGGSPRFFNDTECLYGLDATYDMTMNSKLSLSNIIRKPSDSNLSNINLTTIAYRLANDKITLNSSLNSSLETNNKGWGYEGNLAYNFKRTSASIDYLFASDEYLGYYNNSEYVSVNLNEKISTKYGLSFSYYLSKLNRQLNDFEFLSQPVSENYSAGFSGNYTNFNYRFDYFYSRSYDTSDLNQFNFIDTGVRFNTNFKFNRINLTNLVSYSDTQNKLFNGFVSKSFMDRLSLTYSHNKYFSFGGFVNYISTNKFLDVQGFENLLFYGANVSFCKNNLNVNFTYRNNFAKDELVSTKSLFDIVASYSYRNYMAGFKAGVYRSPEFFEREDDVFLNFTLSKRFGLPTKKKTDYSKLSVYVEKYGGNFKEDITLVVNGVEYKPNDLGVYVINNLSSDNVLLNVLDQSIPNGYIIAESLPMPIKLSDVGDVQVDLNLVKGSILSGNINFENDKFNSKVKNKDYVFYLKLKSKDNSYYTESRNGKFWFQDLKSGSYSLEVLNKDFSKNFKESKIIKTNIKINTGSDEKVKITLNKLKRNIIFK